MTSFEIIRERIREIGAVRFFGYCVATGLYVYVMAVVFVLAGVGMGL